MSKDYAKSSGPKRFPSAITATFWVVAIGAPALALHVNRVNTAANEAEGRLLKQVAQAIQSPVEGREQIMAQLARRQRELDDTRYVRVCNRLGKQLNWNTLFAEIRQSSRDHQIKAAHVIAKECGLDPDTPLKSEQMMLSLRLLQSAPVENTLPVLRPLPRSID